MTTLYTQESHFDLTASHIQTLVPPLYGFTTETLQALGSNANVILVDNTRDVLAVDGTISLREAINFANLSLEDDVILLRGGETYTLSRSGSGEDNNQTGDFDLLGNVGGVTITAADSLLNPFAPTVIQGNQQDRLFDLKAGAALTLENLTITGGKTTLNEDGGAIAATGASLKVIQSILQNNYAGGDGGAIAINDGLLTVKDTQISNNLAVDDGGGISTKFSQVTLEGTTVSENTTPFTNLIADSGDGGGMAVISSTLLISHSQFLNNVAADPSGGLGIESSIATISDSLIADNRSGGSGGGLGVLNSIVTLNRTEVSRNSTVDNSQQPGGGSVLGGAGGGIGTFSSKLVLNNSQVTANAAEANGGGIAAFSSTVSLTQSAISRNSVSSNHSFGGGIFTLYSTLNLKAVTVAENVNQLSNSGGIEAKFSETMIESSTITNNSAAGRNGGIGAAGGKLTLLNSKVINNRAGSHSGGIGVAGGQLTVNSSLIFGNSAGGNSGGIGLIGSRLTLLKSVISNNTAVLGGGGLGATDSVLTITQNIFTGNRTEGNGGAIATNGGQIIALQNNRFHQNTATLGLTLFLAGTAPQTSLESLIQQGNVIDPLTGNTVVWT